MFFIHETKLLSALTHSLPKQSKGLALWNRKPKRKDSPYLVVRPTLKEHSYILDFMWRYYFPEEPTTSSLGLGNNYNPLLDDTVLKYLAQGMSLIAKCKYSGEIVAASINKTACPWDPDELDQLSKTVACTRTKELLNYYAHIQRAPLLWEKYDTRQIFEVRFLAVSKQHRSKGLGLDLVEASKRLGSDCTFKVVRVNATNHYVGKICEKLNMQLVYEQPYSSYASNRVPFDPLFKTAAPHTSCKVYIDLPLCSK